MLRSCKFGNEAAFLPKAPADFGTFGSGSGTVGGNELGGSAGRTTGALTYEKIFSAIRADFDAKTCGFVVIFMVKNFFSTSGGCDAAAELSSSSSASCVFRGGG